MEIDELKKLAKATAQNAYSPFSKFKVGSAILTTNGDVFAGCNIESSSLTFNICAERNAISNAISGKGNIQIEKVVIYTPTQKAASPCGSCRQLIFEFGKDASVYSHCDSEDYIQMNIRELLPAAFDFSEQ
ncbi:MAG: cytidine deaminase [Cytophagales bacterium]|nr:cytidine deaminase [Cytophagales bacterium]